MSANTTAIVEAVAAPAAVEKPPRRFPPPCWTQDETLALIAAYRERWYALRRGYLRTPDWDAVAAAVTDRCPGASPPKTSAQCRHKMEKLRQRYRAEKQRALSYPYPAGRYFSSWFFFENMECMENGTDPPTSAQNAENNSGDGSRLKSFLDQSIVKLKLKAKTEAADSIPVLGGFSNGVNTKRSNSNSKISNSYTPVQVFDQEEDEEQLVDFGMRKLMNGVPRPPPKSKSKNSNSGKIFDVTGGFHQEMLPQGLRIKKVGKFDPIMESNNNWSHSNFSNNSSDNNYSSGAPGFRAKYWASVNPRPDSRPTTLKRGRNGFEEIVESIKLLGEGFVKMERAKMEMAREIETMRMEMEMKRNEMLLESQKQIVDAFVKGLIEMKKKNKKVKTGVVAVDHTAET